MSSGLLPLGLGLSVWPLIAPFCALKVVVAYVSLFSKKAPGLHMGLPKKNKGILNALSVDRICFGWIGFLCCFMLL